MCEKKKQRALAHLDRVRPSWGYWGWLLGAFVTGLRRDHILWEVDWRRAEILPVGLGRLDVDFG